MIYIIICNGTILLYTVEHIVTIKDYGKNIVGLLNLKKIIWIMLRINTNSVCIQVIFKNITTFD